MFNSHLHSINVELPCQRKPERFQRNTKYRSGFRPLRKQIQTKIDANPEGGIENTGRRENGIDNCLHRNGHPVGGTILRTGSEAQYKTSLRLHIIQRSYVANACP